MLAANIIQLEEEAIFNEWQAYRMIGKRSLTRAREFAEILGIDLESHRIPLLGVVGSKGKGTAAIYASAALAAHGLRVGTITSPGLLTNRDRIRINGQALSERAYLGLLHKIAWAKQQLRPVGIDHNYLSPTGIFILGGIYALTCAKCDVLVVEAGMGGASDEVSLLPLDVVVVTAIFGEHLDVLGPTVRDVARDKLGVVTVRTVGVVSVHQTSTVQSEVDRACTRADACLLTGEPPWFTQIKSLLPPGYGTENALAGVRASAALLVATLEKKFDVAAVRSVVASVHYSGRLSVHQLAYGKLVLDTAISQAGLTTAIAFARQIFGGNPDRILVSLPQAKDFAGFLTTLRNVNTERVFVNLERAHLRYPAPDRWPWRWINEERLNETIISGNVLAVGTVSFISALMRRIGVDGERLFIVDQPES